MNMKYNNSLHLQTLSTKIQYNVIIAINAVSQNQSNRLLDMRFRELILKKHVSFL